MLVIDLATGLSTIDGRASGSGVQGEETGEGRVTGTFTVTQDQ